MTGGNTYLKDARHRPQTPQDFTLLQTLRYEETANGLPPLPSGTVNSSQPPSTANSIEHNSILPISPPPPILNDTKRDSGIAPSPSTAGNASYTEDHPSTSTGGPANDSRLPTIVVQDDAPGATEEQKSQLEMGEPTGELNKSEPLTASEGVSQAEGVEGARFSSGSADSVELADLVSEKIAFSPRGSLLFSGKKMNKPRKSRTDGPPLVSGATETSGIDDREDHAGEEAAEADEQKEQGLVSGKRESKDQTLQPAYRGSRVLSADEMTFSMRVRSMYQRGDEHKANFLSTGQPSSPGFKSVESERTDNSSISGFALGKTEQTQADNRQGVESSTPTTQVSHSRESVELAGAIEDWEDIDGRDVDRYGFINPKRISSRPSTSDQPPRAGVQRVATSLRIESEQGRKNRKQRASAARPANDRVASIHSSQNAPSAAKRPIGNPFRSKDRRVLAEASDMLTLPPGLAESAEQPESSETASATKLRETSREDKWQNMAKVQSQRNRAMGKGGGMQFEFDTNDPKLVSRTWKGIPDRWRATAWHSFLSTSAKKRGIGVSDDELISQFYKLQEEGSAEDVQIDMDVPRTINMHIMFRRRYRGGQRLLFRVLHAISLYFSDIGYVQGMGSLAATLLCYFEEERAFIMMVRLWQLRGMEQLFEAGFEGLMKALEVFEKDWLKRGDVAQKLDELGITSTAYGTRWYLTLFNLSIPFPAQLRVWDVFMLLGDASSKDNDNFGGADLDVLHATSAALIDATRDIIMDSDFENAMKVLTSFVPIKDEDLFMRVGRAEWKLRKKRATKT